MRNKFFVLRAGQPVAGSENATSDFSVELWRPSVTATAPKGVTGKAFRVWWLFHLLHVFANREYALLVVYDGARLIHRSGVYPRYFRFPFMRTTDLQIGDTWTDPAYRGRGLAHAAIVHIVRAVAKPGRDLWYLVEPKNTASIRVIERVGFTFAGDGDRTPRFGLRALGQYHLASEQGG